jgi:hypothetical protein
MIQSHIHSKMDRSMDEYDYVIHVIKVFFVVKD